MFEKFWTFLEKPFTQTGLALVLAIIGTIVPSKLAMLLAGVVFLCAVYREGWLRHGKWYIATLKFLFASAVIACILGAVWVVAWRFRERPSPALTETAQKSNTPEPAPQSLPQQQPVITESGEKLPSEVKRPQPAKNQISKKKSGADASGKPPKAEPDPNTTTETYSTKDSLHSDAHHNGTKDEAKAIVNGGFNQGPGSIAQIGGSNNQATMNNYGPLPRHLNPGQIQEIGKEAGDMPATQKLTVMSTSDAQSQNYASEIYEAIKAMAPEKLTTGPIMGLGGWGGHAPEGVTVCIIRENADTFSTAQKIASTIHSDQTTKVNFTMCTSIEENEIKIIVGPAI